MKFYPKTFEMSRELVDQWCSLTGDDNPIHQDSDDIVRYEKPVVPGFLITSLITHEPEPNWAVAKMNVKYHRPVYVGDTIKVRYNILKERSKLKVIHAEFLVEDDLKQTIEMTTVRL